MFVAKKCLKNIWDICIIVSFFMLYLFFRLIYIYIVFLFSACMMVNIWCFMRPKIVCFLWWLLIIIKLRFGHFFCIISQICLLWDIILFFVYSILLRIKTPRIYTLRLTKTVFILYRCLKHSSCSLFLSPYYLLLSYTQIRLIESSCF